MDAPEITKPNNRNSAIGFVLAMAGIGAFFAFTMWTWNTKNGVIPENQRVMPAESHGGDHGEGIGQGEDHEDELSTGRIGISLPESDNPESRNHSTEPGGH
jgi:hypothetical protein